MVSTRLTTAAEKLLNSAINAGIAFLLFSPFWFLTEFTPLTKKVILIFFFFTLKLILIFWFNNRSPGMVITKTFWKKSYPWYNQLLHAALYTLSFSTMLFWIYFPFDIVLGNILLIQLPTVLKTGTTLHGYLAGKMVTVKHVKKR